MTRAKVLFWIEEKDYLVFRGLVVGDPRLPDTFDEWFKLASDEAAKYEAIGLVHKMIVYPTEFIRFCKSGKINPDGNALAAFAAQEFMRQNKPNP